MANQRRSSAGSTRNRLGIGLALVCAALPAGCTDYYRVRDTETARTYYTTKLDRKGGAVVFTDGKTGNTVSLQNSEVTEIDKDSYARAVPVPIG
jgi:hypothetical protein